MTRGTGSLAQFMSPMSHTHKRKTIVRQKVKMFLSHFANYHIRSKMGGNEI